MLTRTASRAKWMAVFAGVLASVASASEGDALETKFEVFHDRNDVTALSPVFELHKSIARSLSILWEGQFDAVTGASRDWGRNGSGQAATVSNASSGSLDGMSGASEDEKGEPEFRGGTKLGLLYSRDGRVLGGSLYGSKESDYRSVSPALWGAWDFAERNTTLSWAASWFFDELSPEGSWARLVEDGGKFVQSYTLGLSQTLTSLTLAGATVNWIRTTGTIGHPYNPVSSIDSGMIGEALPRRKDALATSGQIVQGFLLGDLLGSVNAEYRYYSDSWDLRSQTLTVQLSQHVSEGTIVRLQGRYYTQTGAAFAQSSIYQGSETYRTADIRLHRFSSWLGGIKLSSDFPEDWGAWSPRRWDLSYDHLLRDTRGDPHLYQLYASDAWYQQGTARAGLGWDL